LLFPELSTLGSQNQIDDAQSVPSTSLSDEVHRFSYHVFVPNEGTDLITKKHPSLFGLILRTPQERGVFVFCFHDLPKAALCLTGVKGPISSPSLKAPVRTTPRRINLAIPLVQPAFCHLSSMSSLSPYPPFERSRPVPLWEEASA